LASEVSHAISHPIALIGLPGSGKSTIGRHLARKWGLEFCDSDSAIETTEGCTVKEIFARYGEAYFREIEALTIGNLLKNSQRVISTGGGSVLREDTRALLKHHCDCIYLRSSPEDLFRRLKHDRKRPLLQVEDPLGVLRDLFIERDPLYQATASYIVDTGRPSVSALVNTISNLLYSERGLQI
jgi:shikimate kinase